MLNSQAAMLGSPTSISVSFNYTSPSQFDSLFLSPKQSHLQNYKHPASIPLQSNTNYINNRNNCVLSDLDTTIELKTHQSMEYKTQNRLKKPLFQSVIIKSTADEPDSSNEINFRQRFSNNCLSPSYRNNITSSCILSESFQNGTNRNPFSASIFDKENVKHFQQSQSEIPKKPFCFNKSKIKVKKREIKLSKAKIQDFNLGEMVGKGSIGRVYVVMHRQTGFYYALKKIVKAQVKDLKQFSLSIKSHILFHHPHIAELYACFNDQEHIYLLMELCTDSNLSKYKKKIKADQEKDKILCGIAKGVEYMHHHQFRHGDIKLQNILVTYGFPKLTDFDCLSRSLSSSFQEIRRKTQLWGSPAYFSPDMIQKCSFSMSDDIWSLGIIAYEIFCGSHPFDLKGSQDLSKIVQKEVKPLLKSVKESTRVMICKMLEKNGRKRVSLYQIIEYFGMGSA